MKSILLILLKLFKAFRRFLSQILKKSKKSIVARQKCSRKTNRNKLWNVSEKTKFDHWTRNFFFENLFSSANRRLRKNLRFSRNTINCNRSVSVDFANNEKFKINNVEHWRCLKNLCTWKKIRISKNWWLLCEILINRKNVDVIDANDRKLDIVSAARLRFLKNRSLLSDFRFFKSFSKVDNFQTKCQLFDCESTILKLTI